MLRQRQTYDKFPCSSEKIKIKSTVLTPIVNYFNISHCGRKKTLKKTSTMKQFYLNVFFWVDA